MLKGMAIAAKSSAVRATSAPLPSRQRSKVTNGRALFVVGSGTSAWARRLRDLIEAHCRDVSPDGPDHLTEAQRSLIRRASCIELELEAIEGRLSQGDEASLPVYAAASGHLRRILEALGIERKQKIVIDPLTYAREHTS
jgi:hypothetical protein